MTMTFDRAYDFLLEFGIATEEEIALVTAIIGNSIETLDKIAYAKAGYSTVSSLMEAYDETLGANI